MISLVVELRGKFYEGRINGDTYNRPSNMVETFPWKLEGRDICNLDRIIHSCCVK